MLADRSLVLRIKADDVPIFMNGHHGHRFDPVVYSDTYFSKSDWGLRYIIDSMSFFMLTLDERDEGTLNRWLAGEQTESQLVGETTECYHCGEYTAAFFDGQKIEFRTGYGINGTNKPCKYPGGQGEFKVQIDIPSSAIVFANDFRPIMGEWENFNVNSLEGIKLTVEQAAEQNMFTAFVGNTCPGVFVDASGDIVIGNEGSDYDTDELTDPLGDSMGSICTDLWWFYAMDSAAYEESGSPIEVEARVEVEPGRYEMTVHVRPSDDDRDWSKAEKFATITRIGDCHQSY